MILFEKHTPNETSTYELRNGHLKQGLGTGNPHNTSQICKCSYCYGNNKIHYGLNIPKDKSWNSWFVIKYWPGRYMRFTLPFLKKYKPSTNY